MELLRKLLRGVMNVFLPPVVHCGHERGEDNVDINKYDQQQQDIVGPAIAE
jgi:hypothetical protein